MMALGGWRRRLLAGVLVGLCVGAGGCGSGEAASEAQRGSPEAFAARLAGLLADATTSASCEPVDAISARSPADIACPASSRTRRQLAGFELVDARRYGSGATVAYRRADGSEATMVLARAHDGGWALSRLAHRAPSPASAAGPGWRRSLAAVHAYLRRPARAHDDVLAAALRGTPSTRSRYLGGDGTYAFHALVTDDPVPRYHTLVTVRKGSGAGAPGEAVDAVLGPVEKAVRELRASSPAGAPTDHVVQILDDGFRPTRLRIDVGDRVTFVNRGGGPHTALHDPSGAIDASPEPGPTDHSGNDVNRATEVGFRTHALFADEPQTILFEVAGGYRYRCSFHGDHVGRIDVAPRTGSAG